MVATAGARRIQFPVRPHTRWVRMKSMGRVNPQAQPESISQLREGALGFESLLPHSALPDSTKSFAALSVPSRVREPYALHRNPAAARRDRVGDVCERYGRGPEEKSAGANPAQEEDRQNRRRCNHCHIADKPYR